MRRYLHHNTPNTHFDVTHDDLSVTIIQQFMGKNKCSLMRHLLSVSGPILTFATNATSLRPFKHTWSSSMRIQRIFVQTTLYKTNSFPYTYLNWLIPDRKTTKYICRG